MPKIDMIGCVDDEDRAFKIGEKEKEELVKCIRKLKREINMDDVRACLTDRGMDYHNWTDLDMILYCLTGEEPY